MERDLKSYIIHALDVEDFQEAKELIDEDAPYVGSFKVGLELITDGKAVRVIDYLHAKGAKVMYDGKFADIPNTVAGAAKKVAKMGCESFTIHASCGEEAMRRAVASGYPSRPIAVTVLTSLSEEECVSIFGDVPNEKVFQFASKAFAVGVRDLVCSPQELKYLRQFRGLDTMFIRTPGVRPKWAAKGDQSRVTTPTIALKEGADALVIGRPIRNPPRNLGWSRADAARNILEEIAEALVS